MHRTKLTHWIFCALFAALTGICTQIALQVGPIPFNLATLSVILSGAILGAKYGALSQVFYLLLGAFGVPVFSAFRGGLAVLAGPTGGYIVGYIAGAWLVGLIAERLGYSARVLVPAMAAGILALYTTGTIWYIISTHTPLWSALMMCVIPFLPVDACKIALAAVLVTRLRPALNRTAMAG